MFLMQIVVHKEKVLEHANVQHTAYYHPTQHESLISYQEQSKTHNLLSISIDFSCVYDEARAVGVYVNE